MLLLSFGSEVDEVGSRSVRRNGAVLGGLSSKGRAVTENTEEEKNEKDTTRTHGTGTAPRSSQDP